jgi:hypothetical protein
MQWGSMEWVSFSGSHRKAMAINGSSNLNHPKMIEIKAGVQLVQHHIVRSEVEHMNLLMMPKAEMQQHLGWQLGK